MSVTKARRPIHPAVSRAVLTEAGYRCAVPTCRTTLAIDLHHLVGISSGGGNEASNLLALCPNCHALFHRGTIHREALQVWKGLLIALNEGVGTDAKDLLLLLSIEPTPGQSMFFSADGVLRFAGLAVAGLVGISRAFPQRNNDVVHPFHGVYLTDKGRALVAAWKAGDRAALAAAQ